MRRQARTCPACGHKFIPWQAWKITRWSNIACPSCQAPLNRKVDAQLFLIAIAAWLVLTVVNVWLLSSLAARVVSFFAVVVALELLDTFTMRLVRAGERRGIRGYKT